MRLDETVIAMPPIRPVHEHHVVYLTNWIVLETNEGSRHFAGWNSHEKEGRVSSAIKGMSIQHLVGRTLSGRVYQLVGANSSLDKVVGDVSAVIVHWADVCGVKYYRDITETVLKEKF